MRHLRLSRKPIIFFGLILLVHQPLIDAKGKVKSTTTGYKKEDIEQFDIEGAPQCRRKPCPCKDPRAWTVKQKALAVITPIGLIATVYALAHYFASNNTNPQPLATPTPVVTPYPIITPTPTPVPIPTPAPSDCVTLVDDDCCIYPLIENATEPDVDKWLPSDVCLEARTDKNVQCPEGYDQEMHMVERPNDENIVSGWVYRAKNRATWKRSITGAVVCKNMSNKTDTFAVPAMCTYEAFLDWQGNKQNGPGSIGFWSTPTWCQERCSQARFTNGKMIYKTPANRMPPISYPIIQPQSRGRR